MNDSDENDLELDLAVSEAFGTLDTYQPIDVAAMAARAGSSAAYSPASDGRAATSVGAPIATGVSVIGAEAQPEQPRGRYLLAMAAAVALVVAVAGVMVFNRDEPVVVAAGAEGDAGQVIEAETSTASTSVEDETIIESTVAPSEAEEMDDVEPTTTTSADSPDSSVAVESPSADDPEAQQPEQPTTTAAPEPGTTSEAPAVEEPAEPVTTTIPEPVTSTTGPDIEEPADTLPPTSGQPEVVRGQVTEILTDCVSHMILGDDGQPIEAGPVVCDGGSYVVVGGKKIVTSSGFLPDSPGFNNHPQDLQVGDMAEFVAVYNVDRGTYSLACDTCGQQS